MKKNSIFAIFTVLIVLAGLTSCIIRQEKSDAQFQKNEKSAKSASLKKLTFVLDWTPNTNHTGLYVAQKKGYFADEGIELTIVQPPEGGAALLIASGKADFGVGFQESLSALLVGDTPLPITAIATIINHNTSGIISLKTKGIESAKGLEGKKYATWDLPIEKAIIKTVMEKEHADFSKLELIPSTVSDEVSALQSNSVDAIWVFYAWGGIATEVAGLETNYFAFADIDPTFDFYTPILITNNMLIDQNPELIRAFLRAVSKGYTDAIANPQEASDILCELNPEIDKTLALESQKYLADKYQADAPKWGYIDSTRWNRFYDWLTQNNLSKEPIPENAGFTNKFLPE